VLIVFILNKSTWVALRKCPYDENTMAIKLIFMTTTESEIIRMLDRKC